MLYKNVAVIVQLESCDRGQCGLTTPVGGNLLQGCDRSLGGLAQVVCPR